MKFSERQGFKPVSDIMQVEGMTRELRNSIWNVLHIYIWTPLELEDTYINDETKTLSRKLWFGYFKEPIDSIPDYAQGILDELKDSFFKCEWYEVYDFVEFLINIIDKYRREKLTPSLNSVLKRELSGYRFLSGLFIPITDKQEVAMLEEALRDTRFSGPTAHLQRALELLADRENPDYRNSIKESISAVESMARIITDSPKATLGDAFKVLERSGKLHKALKAGFSSLYGYTSDEGGIRHAMLEEVNISSADAKYFLLSCTSFVNYLKAKI